LDFNPYPKGVEKYEFWRHGGGVKKYYY